MRTTTVERNTKETKIRLTLSILSPEENGFFKGSCGVGFFDHMLDAICVHGKFAMDLEMTGDLNVDTHHSLEDLGIVLGKAFYELTRGQALSRFGTAFIPMDEALSRCVLDISGRPYLVFDATFSSPYIGAMETCMFREFFYAFAIHAAVTLHLSVLYGDNDHHKAESLCKAFAYALRQACAPVSGAVLSTKGTLEK